MLFSVSLNVSKVEIEKELFVSHEEANCLVVAQSRSLKSGIILFFSSFPGRSC